MHCKRSLLEESAITIITRELTFPFFRRLLNLSLQNMVSYWLYRFNLKQWNFILLHFRGYVSRCSLPFNGNRVSVSCHLCGVIKLYAVLIFVDFHVATEIIRPMKTLATQLTAIRAFTGMNTHVSSQVRFGAEGLLTYLTDVRFLSCVDHHVFA